MASVYDQKVIKFYDDDPEPAFLLNNDIKAKDTLFIYGINSNQVRIAARAASSIDINTLNKKNIPNNRLFEVSHINMACSKGTEGFDRFTDRYAPGNSLNLSSKKVSELLELGLVKARDISQHYFALQPYLVEGTTEGAVTKASHKRFVNSVNEAIFFTSDRGGSIRPPLEQCFNTRNLGVLLNLDEA